VTAEEFAAKELQSIADERQRLAVDLGDALFYEKASHRRALEALARRTQVLLRLYPAQSDALDAWHRRSIEILESNIVSYWETVQTSAPSRETEGSSGAASARAEQGAPSAPVAPEASAGESTDASCGAEDEVPDEDHPPLDASGSSTNDNVRAA
jgi:hypothetical protein